MMRRAWLGALLLAGGLSAGCVTRSYTITTDPPLAIVYRNGVPLGPSPVDENFVYYGNYHFTLIHDGYETLQVDQKIPPPWYEYPVLDFISENLIPWQIEDVRRFHYALQPLQLPRADLLLERAQGLRTQGQTLVPLAPPLPLEAPSPGPPVPGGDLPLPDRPE